MKVAAIHGDERAASAAPAVTQTSKGADFANTLARTAGAAENGGAATHTVQRGETLSHIVRDHLRDSGREFQTRDIYAGVREVARENGLRNPNRIYPGQELDLAPLHGGQTVARPEAPKPAPKPAEETAAKASSEPRVDPPEVEPFFADLGEIQVEPEDKSAESKPEPPQRAEQHAALAPATEERIRTFVDDMKATFTPARTQAADKSSLWSAILEDPGRITSEFGMRKSPITGRWQYHRGVDIAADQGTAIYPLKAGEVVYSGWKSGYGNVVIVQHENNTETVYGHNARNLVQTGDAVSNDTALGTVGATGHATGPHVHFEVRRHGHSVDPVPVLKAHAAEGDLRAQR